MRIAALYAVYNDEDFIEYSLRSIYSEIDEIVICLATKPWFGQTRKPDSTLKKIKNFPDPQNKITLITGQWPSEPVQRQAALDVVKDKITHCLVIDADELYKCGHLRMLKEIAAYNPQIGQFRVGMNTYWKSPLVRIDPPEPYMPLIISRVTPQTRFVDLRATNEGPVASIRRSDAILYHFSCVRTQEKMKAKIENFSHADEIRPGWFKDVWMAWDDNPLMENIHSTHAHCYRRAIFEPKECLPKVMWSHPWVKNGLSAKVKKKIAELTEMKTVVVLGPARSGTSITSGILHLSGVNMGDRMTGPHRLDAKGNFENLLFERINNMILVAAGGSWHVLPAEKAIKDIEKQVSDEIEALIEMESSRLWGFKDPRTCATFPVYKKHITNPHFIVCQRTHEHIVSSVRNYAEHINVPIQDPDGLVKENYKRIESIVKGEKSITIQYEDYFPDPKPQIKKLLKFLEIEADIDRLAQFVDPTLNHAGKM